MKRSAEWPELVLTALVLVGLAIDAYVHLHLAGDYSKVRTSRLSQADLFRFEAGAALVAGGALLARARLGTAMFALMVAGSGAAAVFVYRYWDPGTIGVFPDMYEPVWFTEKLWAFWGETVAAISAAGLAVFLTRPSGGEHW